MAYIELGGVKIERKEGARIKIGLLDGADTNVKTYKVRDRVWAWEVSECEMSGWCE